VLGYNVEHRCSAFLNRRIEQDHRGIKQRYYPMLGFWCFPLGAALLSSVRGDAAILSSAAGKRKQFVSLARHRRQFVTRIHALKSMFLAS
jgi:transposase-like protein